MTRRMLIDAAHPEETRIAITDNTKLLELDFESASKKQIKGNIYLAKVTRIEPSLQAAFVEYGGGRQGFLSFTEIHPDYYRIPIADRQALMEEAHADMASEAEAEENAAADEATDDTEDANIQGDDDTASDVVELSDDEDNNGSEDAPPPAPAEQLAEEAPRRTYKPRRQYKIQEVLKKNQVLLVQVVKEERGNKGAAITTYLSLAGRYCVLMPNSPRSGGVSRKISGGKDRKRLKEVLDELQIPAGISVILRTAGSDRTKTEIKRDYEYLVRLWDDIRQLTLQSVAPALIHEEGNLMKRALRDLYSRDIEEVLVEGEEVYKEAKAFMKMLVPSHAKKVKHYKDEQAHLFHKYQVEKQIEAMFQPVAQLPSGGYIVINQTEALVSIDVNSGKAIRERHIEETALKTNLEAAAEIALQLRLRDLAGLIVVDFIDMEDRRNNRTVENRFKDALRTDRARIQVGRISGFGLMEMSRQRLRPALHEISTTPCDHCGGTGMVRSVESLALQALRAAEEEALHEGVTTVTVYVPARVALYIINNKRAQLMDIETRFSCTVVLAEDADLAANSFRVDSDARRGRGGRKLRKSLTPYTVAEDSSDADEEEDTTDGAAPEQDEETPVRKRRRRRGGRGRSRGSSIAGAEESNDNIADSDSDAEHGDDSDSAAASSVDGGDDARPRTRRRGRRGGRGRNRSDNNANDIQDADNSGDREESADDSSPESRPEPAPQTAAPAAVAAAAPEPAPAAEAPAAVRKPRVASSAPVAVEVVDEAPSKPRRGWWRRTGGE